MPSVIGAKNLTEKRFLNMYELDVKKRDGNHMPYYMATRAKKPEDMKIANPNKGADCVVIYGVYGEKKDKIVLIRQYRYPIADYIYEFPAGIIENGENVKDAATREIFEETGLNFIPVDGGNFEKPFFTSVGMTDESIAMAFGYCNGEPTNANQESSEDIEVVIADREECKRILREENVAVTCAYMMMHFIASAGDPFDFLNEV